MKRNNKNPNDNKEVNQYIKQSFIRRLPFGVKATFIKYWFYGATYFLCYMGLGIYIKTEDYLVLVCGLVGGVLFDIALYNIYLLIAETRQEASRWWIFKSKRFYSIFVNVIVLIGIFFAFNFIVAPITAAMAKPGQTVWLFHEPLSAAIILTILDSGIVWAKNGLIVLFNKLFRKELKRENTADAFIKVIEVTPVSVSIELNNKDVYYANKPFNVLLNNEIILKKVTTNSFTIFDLKPDTQYHITINRQNAVFTTPKIYKAYKVYENNDIQKVIDLADQYSLIIVNKGTYKIKSLMLKSNIVLYIRKDAKIIAGGNLEDYPIIPSYDNDEEIYGNYKGEPHKMRQSIIHLDHLKNVKIVGEGSIESQLMLNPKDKIAPPHLMFINHSSNISLIGLTLKNSPQWSVHPFFSDDINLINLNINNDKEVAPVDGITPECSNNINIIGCHFANLKKGVALKSGKKEIAKKYHTSTSNVIIRNCFMERSNNAICFGSEASGGINKINISRSYFVSTDTGIIVNTKRGSGKDCIFKDINVNYIKMDGVLTPITMNMFFSNNPKKEDERTLTKKFIPLDDETPYLNNFEFKNLEVKNFEYACGYFYGLPEKYIYEIKIVDSIFTPKDICNDGLPIEIDGIDKCSKKGFIATNVRSIELKNVKLNNINGDRIVVNNVSEIVDK